MLHLRKCFYSSAISPKSYVFDNGMTGYNYSNIRHINTTSCLLINHSEHLRHGGQKLAIFEANSKKS